MKTFKKIANAADQPKVIKSFPTIESETRTHVSTECAAFHLNRQQQTLRGWAISPLQKTIKPIRINKRLAWPVADIRRLLAEGTEK